MGRAGQQVDSTKNSASAMAFGSATRDAAGRVFISLDHEKSGYGRESPGEGLGTVGPANDMAVHVRWASHTSATHPAWTPTLFAACCLHCRLPLLSRQKNSSKHAQGYKTPATTQQRHVLLCCAPCATGEVKGVSSIHMPVRMGQSQDDHDGPHQVSSQSLMALQRLTPCKPQRGRAPGRPGPPAAEQAQDVINMARGAELGTVSYHMVHACRPQRVQRLGRLGPPAAERARDAAAVAHGHRAPLCVGWLSPVCCRARPWTGSTTLPCPQCISPALAQMQSCLHAHVRAAVTARLLLCRAAWLDHAPRAVSSATHGHVSGLQPGDLLPAVRDNARCGPAAAVHQEVDAGNWIQPR